MKKDQALRKIKALLAAREREGYEIVFEDEDSYLLVDQSKNILLCERSWFLFKEHGVRETILPYGNLKEIATTISPSGLHSSYNDYAVGGAMAGGITGAIIGSIIDSVRGPKREYVSLNLRFESDDELDLLMFMTAYSMYDVEMSERGLEPVITQLSARIDKLKQLFPDHEIRSRMW